MSKWTLTDDPNLVNGLSVVDDNGAIVFEPYRDIDWETMDMPNWCAHSAEKLARKMLKKMVKLHNKEQ